MGKTSEYRGQNTILETIRTRTDFMDAVTTGSQYIVNWNKVCSDLHKEFWDQELYNSAKEVVDNIHLEGEQKVHYNDDATLTIE